MENQSSMLQVPSSLPEPITGGGQAMEEQSLTLQVRPKSVAAIERLAYKTQIFSRADTKLVSSSGRVEIRVPYDGTEYFEAREIKRAKKASLPQAVCGYVGMEWPDAGPMDKPIKVPIEICCDDLDRHVASGSEAIMSVEYAMPEALDRLVYVDATLVDDRLVEDWRNISDSFTEHLRLRIRAQCYVGNISQAAWQAILEQAEQERRDALKEYNHWKNLGVSQGDIGSEKEPAEDREAKQKALRDAEDRLNRLTTLLESLKKLDSKKAQEITAEAVSEAIARAREEDEERLSEETRQRLDKLDQFVRNNLSGANLTYVGIEWPYTEQELETGERSEWLYNPEAQRMEQWNIPMKWDRNSRAYEVVLLLDLYRPAEDVPTIRGQMVLETDKLVSGMQFCWIDSKGNIPRKPQLNFRTIFTLDIKEIQLSEVFHQRRQFPRRQLIFKSVLPTVERLHEVENVLGDAGLTILNRSYGTDINSVDLSEGCWLEATQRQIGLPMKVWVVIRGAQKSGKHTVIYDGGRQHLEANVPLGDLHVELFARIAGLASVISEVLDNIQIRLQQVFENVSSMVW